VGRTCHDLQLDAAVSLVRGDPLTPTPYDDPVIRETIGRTESGQQPDVLQVESILRVEVAR
jgi:hypothetical protein